MIERRYPTLSSLTGRTTKKIGLLVVLLLSLYLIYDYKYGYTNFDVEDVRQPATFSYKKTKNPRSLDYAAIVVRVKGEIKGRARVKIDYCNHLKSTSYWYTPRINLIVTGKVDTVMSAENYIGQACIEYKPRNVEGGELSIAVSAR